MRNAFSIKANVCIAAIYVHVPKTRHCLIYHLRLHGGLYGAALPFMENRKAKEFAEYTSEQVLIAVICFSGNSSLQSGRGSHRGGAGLHRGAEVHGSPIRQGPRQDNILAAGALLLHLSLAPRRYAENIARSTYPRIRLQALITRSIC